MNKRQKKKFRKKFCHKKWSDIIVVKEPRWMRYCKDPLYDGLMKDYIGFVSCLSITKGCTTKPDYEKMEIREIEIDDFTKDIKDAIHWLSGIDRGGFTNEQASEEEIRKEEQVQDILWISTSGDISKDIQTYRPKE